MHTIPEAVIVDELRKFKIEQLDFVIASAKDFKEDLQKQMLENEKAETKNIKCIYCGYDLVYGHGKTSSGRQRYECQICGSTFSIIYFWCFKKMKHNYYSKFLDFIQCMIDGKSIKQSSKTCKISVITAYRWRHRILNAINEFYSSVNQISGKIQLDETYFKDCAKGSWTVGKGKEKRNVFEEKFNRKPRKRGKEYNLKGVRGLSKNLVCISTAINDKNDIVIANLGFGRPTTESLIEAYKNKIINPEKTTIVTDGDNAYPLFVKELGCTHIPLKSIYPMEYKVAFNFTNKYYKDDDKNKPINSGEIDDQFEYDLNELVHIQNVNKFHQELKQDIIGKYKGVNTYNLVKYANFVKWKKLNKSDDLRQMQNRLFKFLLFKNY